MLFYLLFLGRTHRQSLCGVAALRRTCTCCTGTAIGTAARTGTTVPPCQAVHRCMRSSAMCAPVHRPTGSDLCSGLWLGQACSGSQASRLSHALLKKTITYLLHKIYFFIFYSRCTKSCIGLLAQNLTCVCPLPAAAARPPAFGLRPSACVSKLAQSSLPQACP